MGGNFNFLCANADCTTTGQMVNGIARWTPGDDSGTWTGVGNGFNFSVDALALDHHNNLYAGGRFSSICGDPNCLTFLRTNYLAVWDGQSWSKLGNGVSDRWR